MGLFSSELVAALKARGIAWFATATTLSQANRAEKAGADAIIAQGIEAGGHRRRLLMLPRPSDRAWDCLPWSPASPTWSPSR